MATSKELFRRFANLCQKWPKDETKVGRDYGEYFRSQLSRHFPHGEQSQLNNIKEVERAISSLERLANNKYYNENPLKRSSASGLDAWACRQAISNDGIKILEEDEKSVVNRLLNSLGVRFSSSRSDYKYIDEMDLKDKDKDTVEKK
uniref:Mitochondrial nucleoid factor 1 n=1 Tax=Aceria tosichella TaxID=561515 RepID=A0A6G1S7U4_9ACAR